MATDRTMAKPLSGLEVIEAIVSRVREQLQRDCFLAPHMAYPSYSFQAKLDIQFQGSRIEGTVAHVNGADGEPDANLPTQIATVELSESPKPPNEVRRGSGQGVPVQVKTPTGRVEERRVRYAKPAPKSKTPSAA